MNILDKLEKFPPISCVCPTFGRVSLLEEALESFLRQDYKGKKQLIIINDFDQQTLMFDHPEVTIINLKERISNLGLKRNMTVEYADYDIIANWDSDDIYLPHSLSTRIKLMDADFTRFRTAFFLSGKKLSIADNNFHAQGIYTKKIFELVGGYPEYHSGQDVEFEKLIPLNNYSTHRFDEDNHKISYIYRWYCSPIYIHLSALGKNNSYTQQLIYSKADNDIKDGIEPSGEIYLSPKWNSPFVKMTKSYLDAI